jgi:hypothetical protein
MKASFEYAFYGGIAVTFPDFLRSLLFASILAMAFLSFVFLSRRRMSWGMYLGFGLLAALVPVLGPFTVIALRPGQWRNAAPHAQGG